MSRAKGDRQEGIEKCWHGFGTKFCAAGANFRQMCFKNYHALLAVLGDL